jgi:hypothetical protein
MTLLLLAIVLGAPAEAPRGGGWPPAACSVRVLAVDPQGTLVSMRAASGSLTPAVVFRGRAARVPEGAPPLVFDVFDPRGERYRVLLGRPSGRPATVNGEPSRPGRTVEARMAVAATSIQWTSLYGRWRVVPRFEGHDSACGRAQAFTIRP